MIKEIELIEFYIIKDQINCKMIISNNISLF